jgi:hypothetical protein
MKRYILLIVSALFCFGVIANAQNTVVKTNLLYWATTTPNVGVEFTLAPRWTLELEGGYNPWTFNVEKNIKAKHFLVSPEARYWFCEAFHGHFLGLNANYTQFNVGGIPFFKDRRQEGWAVGAGLTYGCSSPIARCWNIEANLGLGLWYTDYGVYEARKCGLFNESVSKFAFGPTSLGLSFVYIIK